MTPETAQLIRPPEGAVRAFDRAWLATPNNVSRSSRTLLACLAEAGVADDVLESIGIAITEVTTNTVYHAYVGRRIGQFRITATVEPGEVQVTVDDDGAGFDDGAPHRVGRGLALVESHADRLEMSSPRGTGTRTTVWFAR